LVVGAAVALFQRMARRAESVHTLATGVRALITTARFQAIKLTVSFQVAAAGRFILVYPVILSEVRAQMA